jgi:PAP2 superfamily
MHHNYKYAGAAAIALALLSFSKPASADVITDWNLITVKATKVAKFNSNLGSRIEAIEAIAVYDAVNSIKKFGTPYHYYAPPSGPASAQAAVAQAAHDVLVNYFPAQKAHLDSALTNSLSTANDGPIDKGQAVGAASAADIIALRANDGSDPNVGYPGPAKPGVGQYRPTPAGFLPGINEQWGTVKPFLLTSNTQFRPVAPPAVETDDFKKALAAVEELGASSSTKRTDDQTHIAQFYKQDAELTVNEAARELALNQKTSLEVNALAFVLADIAEADARIGLWDAKYNYLLWRPVTALNADADGAVTNNYTKWTPLLSTPPHPSYPCGHCGTVTAGFEVLKTFYGDKDSIQLHTTTPGEPARTISSLSKGEWENGWSRIYGGIHYPFENEAAQKLGKQVAEYVLAHGPKRK